MNSNQQQNKNPQQKNTTYVQMNNPPPMVNIQPPINNNNNNSMMMGQQLQSQQVNMSNQWNTAPTAPQMPSVPPYNPNYFANQGNNNNMMNNQVLMGSNQPPQQQYPVNNNMNQGYISNNNMMNNSNQGVNYGDSMYGGMVMNNNQLNQPQPNYGMSNFTHPQQQLSNSRSRSRSPRNKNNRRKSKSPSRRKSKSPRRKSKSPRRSGSVMERLLPVLRKYRIDKFYHADLKAMKKFDIVVIGDDSGSMKAKVDHSQKTRWDELKEVMRIVTELGTALDDDGIDIMFLNRRGMKNVTSYQQIKPLFKKPPRGFTPLAKAVRKALRRKQQGKKMLLVIATDGEPTTEEGKVDKMGFLRSLKERDTHSTFVSILACSDNEREIGYLNNIDVRVKNVDVLDDFRSERKEVLRAQGRDFPYSFGDHVARLLLGPVYPKYDLLDERSLRKSKKKRKSWNKQKQQDDCCVM